MKSSSFYIPSVDVSPYLENPSSVAAAQVVDQIRAACISTGFFQIVGHGVPRAVQRAAFDASSRFFALPQESKLKFKTSISSGWKGYEALSAQSYEADMKGDLKEGFCLSIDLPEGHPLRGVSGRFMATLNPWPSDLLADDEFRKPIEAYSAEMARLVGAVMDLVAATLPYGPGIFDGMKVDAACPLRLLHYPPMPSGTDTTKQKSAGAHTDFSAVTLLLQDEHEGLEVLDYETGEWKLVPPNPDAYVINLGDMMTKMLGDRYRSSKHRVINRAPTDRYSIVFFFDGNRDFELKPLDGPVGGAGNHYMTCEEYIFDRIRATFGRSQAHDLKVST